MRYERGRAPAGCCNVSLDTMLVEISKLEAIRAIGLPVGLFADVAPSVVAGWRARAAVESPSHLRGHPQPTKLALLCALLVLREREVTLNDALPGLDWLRITDRKSGAIRLTALDAQPEPRNLRRLLTMTKRLALSAGETSDIDRESA